MQIIDKKKFWEKKIINWENARYKKEVQNFGLLEKLSVLFSSSLIYRQYLANQILQKYIKNKIVIEVGCGSGFLAKNIIFGGAKYYYGYDISDNAIDRANHLAKKFNINDRVKFEAKPINELKKLNCDIVFSLGTLDWLDDCERKNLFKISSGLDCLHSISEKRNSLAQLLHRLYVYMSYSRKNLKYAPIYLNVKEVTDQIKQYSDKNIYIYRNKKLSFGTIISTLKLD